MRKNDIKAGEFYVAKVGGRTYEVEAVSIMPHAKVWVRYIVHDLESNPRKTLNGKRCRCELHEFAERVLRPLALPVETPFRK